MSKSSLRVAAKRAPLDGGRTSNAKRVLPVLGIAAGAALLVTGMFSRPRPSQAMPQFAQATGLPCSACHTMVPLLNAYGRYIQNSGYSPLDRNALLKTFPIWLDASLNYDSTAGAGTGVPRFDGGNVGLHAIGYALPNVTYHVQQWFASGSASGGLDTLWAAYNHLGNPDTHLFFGKLEVPAPSPYSQDTDLDIPSASSTLAVEHDWSATIDGNRWGTKLAYLKRGVDVEAAYVLSSDDLNGYGDFAPGDKTFMWKTAYAYPKTPVEAGLFGTVGSVPVSTGTDAYNSVAAYIQVDPGKHYRPGGLIIYQNEHDSNPGADVNGNPTPPLATRGFSGEINELLFRGNLLVSFRHDFNDMGTTLGTTNGNAINASFNVPGIRYLHGYLEANVGNNSSIYGVNGGPQWKGMLWLTLPFTYPH